MNLETHKHGNPGFTLIEIMAVVLIIGMLSGIVGFAVFQQVDKARVVTAKTQIARLESSLELYNMDNGHFPTSEQGLEALMGALTKGNHQRYIDHPESLGDAGTVADGNAILGHLLGSKDVSRQVTSHAAATTGLDDGLLKKMLPVLASMVMGSMSKQATAGNMAGGNAAAGGLRTQLLDSDKDGSVIDDILGMAGRFMR